MDEINRVYLETHKNLCDLLTTRLKLWDQIGGRDNLEEVFRWEVLKNPEANSLFPEFSLDEQIGASFRKIDEIAEQAKTENILIPLEKLCEEYKLSKDEKTILAFLFFKRLSGEDAKSILLLKLISSPGDLLSKIKLFSSKGTLRKEGLIEVSKEYFRENEPIILERKCWIGNKVFLAILGMSELEETGDYGLFRPRRNTSILLVKNPEVSFDHLILPSEIKNRIEEVLWQYMNGDRVYETYGLKEKIPYGRAVAMLFYGPPGTGKTATSEAIAKQLGKKIGIANYAQIYNCYVGESEKGIVKAFEETKMGDCILLFDEADSLFGQRIAEQHCVDRMHNLMTNLLMQQMEKFSGMVILTTNREVVIDPAFERRLLLKLRFDPHTPEIRTKIWHSLLKDCSQLCSDVNFEELGHYPFSGGKIKNAVIKTVMRCATADKPITISDLIQSAAEETKTGLVKDIEIGF